jgi:hypothetical protein
MSEEKIFLLVNNSKPEIEVVKNPKIMVNTKRAYQLDKQSIINLKDNLERALEVLNNL